jgi:GntR family transcriptional regulator / MocR family aminotransferase
MTEIWAKSSGLDLHLDVSGTRVRAQLEAALRDAIRSGRLKPGTRLPSSRTLAADLGVARNTVAEVFTQLVAEGWLTARTGSGTMVAGRTPFALPTEGKQQQLPAGDAARQAPRYDLRPGEPDCGAFPRAAWLAAARKALAEATDRDLAYGDPRGLPALRTVLAGYLARARGVTASPEHIVICSGYSHGLSLIARATGGTFGVEEYGHPYHRDLITAEGAAIRPLRLDDDGAVLDRADGCSALVLTPAHQFPLGVTLHPRRRREAAGWARDTGGFIVEDDYDGEFRYDRQPVGALQPLAPGHVVYAGTTSKSLAPGLRLGWLAIPPRLLEPVLARLSGGPSALDQLALAELIESGGYDRQIRRARLAYRRRRDRLAATLAGLGFAPAGIAAGMHAVIEFDRTSVELACLARSSAHGVVLDGLTSYRAREATERSGLVIGYGRPPEHAFTGALARLAAVLTSARLTGGGRDQLVRVEEAGGGRPPARPVPGRTSHRCRSLRAAGRSRLRSSWQQNVRGASFSSAGRTGRGLPALYGYDRGAGLPGDRTGKQQRAGGEAACGRDPHAAGLHQRGAPDRRARPAAAVGLPADADRDRGRQP